MDKKTAHTDLQKTEEHLVHATVNLQKMILESASDCNYKAEIIESIEIHKDIEQLLSRVVDLKTRLEEE